MVLFIVMINGNLLVVLCKFLIMVFIVYMLVIIIVFIVFDVKNFVVVFFLDEILMMLDVVMFIVLILVFLKVEVFVFNFGSGCVNSNILLNFYFFILLCKFVCI